MICPKCGSNNVSVQMVTDTQLKKKGHGVFYWLFFGWLIDLLLWIFLTVPMLIVKIFAPKRYALKSKHSSMCVCQNCGHHWNASDVPKKSFSATGPEPARVAPSSGGRVILERVKADDPAVQALSEYVVMDTETTGLNPETDKIVEIALLKISDGKIVDEYCTLVNPQQHINLKSTKIHGIKDADVLESPVYDEVGEDAVEFLGSCTIIGHNIKFDLDFMAGLIKNITLENDLSWKYVDTIPLAKAAYPDMDNYKLQTLAERFNIETDGAHRARADAIAAWQLFERCRSALAQ